MRSVLNVDIVKCKSIVMLSTEYGEVLTTELLGDITRFDNHKKLIVFLRFRFNNNTIKKKY